MTIQKPTNRVLWYEAIGFGLLIALTWLDLVLPVPGIAIHPVVLEEKWKESVFISTLIAVVGLMVIWLTKCLVARLHRLEGLLRVCAWCGRISEDGKWMPVEEYFARGFKITTSHGVCPECAKQVVSDCQQPPAAPPAP